jgi:hypothetical protein
MTDAPAEILREAAQRIRDTANGAEADHAGMMAIALSLKPGPLAKHLDCWNPKTALAVADSLDAYANRLEHPMVIAVMRMTGKSTLRDATEAETTTLLAVARLVLGERSS